MCVSLCPLPLILSLSNTENFQAPSSSFPSLNYLHILVLLSWTFTALGWTVTILSASSCIKDAPVPSLNSLQKVHASIVLEDVELNPHIPAMVSKLLRERRDRSHPLPCWQFCSLCSPGCWWPEDAWLAHSQLPIHQDPQLLLHSAGVQQLPPFTFFHIPSFHYSNVRHSEATTLVHSLLMQIKELLPIIFRILLESCSQLE